MSLAWDTTPDDVYVVAAAHGTQLSDERAQELCDQLDHDAIEKGVLRYTDLDAQTESMLSDIEDFLLREGVVAGQKQYNGPTPEQEGQVD